MLTCIECVSHVVFVVGVWGDGGAVLEASMIYKSRAIRTRMHATNKFPSIRKHMCVTNKSQSIRRMDRDLFVSYICVRMDRDLFVTCICIHMDRDLLTTEASRPTIMRGSGRG